MSRGVEFSDEDGRRYAIVDRGDLYNNYVLQNAIPPAAPRMARAVIADTTKSVPPGTNLGPLLLSVSLPRGKQAVFPNHAIDSGVVRLTHTQTSRHFVASYTIVTTKTLRARSGFIYMPRIFPA